MALGSVSQVRNSTVLFKTVQVHYFLFNFRTNKLPTRGEREKEIFCPSAAADLDSFFPPFAAKQSLLGGVHYNADALARPAGGIHHALHPSCAEPRQ